MKSVSSYGVYCLHLKKKCGFHALALLCYLGQGDQVRSIFLFCCGATPSNIQRLVLALDLGITAVDDRGTSEMQIEPVLA